MAKKGNNINQIVTRTARKWKERAKQDHKNRRSITRGQQFALDLLDYMEANNIKQKELAERMDVSPQQVNKILRAKANLTFETLDKISEALGVTITTPTIRENKDTYYQPVKTCMQVVHKRSTEFKKEDLSTLSTSRMNPILETTYRNMNEYSYTAGKI